MGCPFRCTTAVMMGLIVAAGAVAAADLEGRNGPPPSAAAGELVPPQESRILGLPVDAALIIAGVAIALAWIVGLVIPGARRRDRARGGGTWGGNGRRG